jgi:hypothetical protein
LAALNNSVRSLSKVPVIVGDHRLEIEIVTPKIDMSLQPEKYNTLDARITARLFQMFMTGNFAAGAKGDDSMKLVRIVARGLESRRNMIRKSIEKQILMKIYDRNEQLIELPTLQFHPKTIAIDFDPGLAAFYLDLMDRDATSLSTTLEQVDLDIDEEAKKKEREEEKYDDLFKRLTPLQDPEEQAKLTEDQLKLQQKFADEQKDKDREFQDAQGEKNAQRAVDQLEKQAKLQPPVPPILSQQDAPKGATVQVVERPPAPARAKKKTFAGRLRANVF